MARFIHPLIIQVSFDFEDLTFYGLLCKLSSRHIQKNSAAYLATELSIITYSIKLVRFPSQLSLHTQERFLVSILRMDRCLRCHGNRLQGIVFR